MLDSPFDGWRYIAMAKRFFDTGLFTDAWFMGLSVEGKLTWVYILANCDHAGIYRPNPELFTFQTGIKSFQTVCKEIGNRLHTLSNGYIFIPKFLKFQYSGELNPNSKIHKSIIDVLNKNEVELILLPNSMYTVKDKDKEKDKAKEQDKENPEIPISEKPIPPEFEGMKIVDVDPDGNRWFENPKAESRFKTEEEKKAFWDRHLGEEPTLSQCESYFVFMGESKEMAKEFWDYYEVRNWFIGETKIGKWKGQATKWAKNAVNFTGKKKQVTPPETPNQVTGYKKPQTLDEKFGKDHGL